MGSATATSIKFTVETSYGDKKRYTYINKIRDAPQVS